MSDSKEYIVKGNEATKERDENMDHYDEETFRYLDYELEQLVVKSTEFKCKQEEEFACVINLPKRLGRIDWLVF